MTKVETYKAFVIDRIRKGHIEPKDSVSAFCRKFHKTERTFWNVWKKAQEQYKNELQAIESKKTDQSINAAKEAVKRDIIDKYERMEILSKMAKGVATRVGEDIIIPTPHDRRGAIDLLNKMEGLYDQKDPGNGVVININVDGMEIQSDEI